MGKNRSEQRFRYATSLMRKLLSNFHLYFSHEVLNSDGRRLFEEMARSLLREKPEYKPYVKRIRKEPSLKNILKLARLLIGEEADELVKLAIKGPCIYRFNLVGDDEAWRE